ncbi:hypothetical protein MM221_14980 [Salipaludibacillus sp. LMS25]|jgi:hypothetical protein|uniref:hypothetical protein n=1 Tax=Salipaludibacillus sp. LMS25 TaxID=2924031 RepID=UPI0020D030D9|nr:hypothetical protein [Salipaludibacillus sp. LMS25]UTR13904.1 hypothetical protein MM221_14980 [Salipaludibacillus sp. LMS25]
MKVKKPAFTLNLQGRDFNEELSCLGRQLTNILISLKDDTKNHDWYIFDILGSSEISFLELFPNNTQGFCIVHSTNELIDRVKNVIQFESGVFLAIEKGRKVIWDFDYLPETEEQEGLQHPLADIEIRAFDYSFFEIYGNDICVKGQVVAHLDRYNQ